MKKKKQEEYVHWNPNTNQPRPKFDSFDEALAHVRLKRIRGVLPYYCQFCGGYHYGKTLVSPDRAEEVQEVLDQSYNRVLEAAEKEAQARMEAQVLRSSLEETNQGMRELVLRHRALLEWLSAVKGPDLETLSKFMTLQDTERWLRDRIPKYLGGAKFQLIGSVKAGGWVAQYVDRKTGEVKVKTPRQPSMIDALGHVYRALQSVTAPLNP